MLANLEGLNCDGRKGEEACKGKMVSVVRLSNVSKVIQQIHLRAKPGHQAIFIASGKTHWFKNSFSVIWNESIQPVFA